MVDIEDVVVGCTGRPDSRRLKGIAVGGKRLYETESSVEMSSIRSCIQYRQRRYGEKYGTGMAYSKTNGKVVGLMVWRVE